MACCYHCKKELDIGTRAGRSDTCPFCGRDLRGCYNCRFYSPSCYNECREPQAERVIDKERSNFCEYFAFGDSAMADNNKDKEQNAISRLEDLFKK